MSKRLYVNGNGSVTEYEITVSGQAGTANVRDSTPAGPNDGISGEYPATITGVTTNDGDGYWYSGEILAVTATSDGLVAIDGDETTFTALAENTVDLPHTLEVTGTGTVTNYQIAVDGPVIGDGDLEQWDQPGQGEITGWVTSTDNADRYAFDGTITDVTYVEGGPAQFRVNGSDAMTADQLTAWTAGDSDDGGAEPGNGDDESNTALIGLALGGLYAAAQTGMLSQPDEQDHEDGGNA